MDLFTRCHFTFSLVYKTHKLDNILTQEWATCSHVKIHGLWLTLFAVMNIFVWSIYNMQWVHYFIIYSGSEIEILKLVTDWQPGHLNYIHPCKMSWYRVTYFGVSDYRDCLLWDSLSGGDLQITVWPVPRHALHLHFEYAHTGSPDRLPWRYHWERNSIIKLVPLYTVMEKVQSSCGWYLPISTALFCSTYGWSLLKSGLPLCPFWLNFATTLDFPSCCDGPRHTNQNEVWDEVTKWSS